MTAATVELYTFDVTIPAGTAQAAPQTTAMTIPVRTVNRIEVLAPDGLNGVVGFRLASSGQQIVPVNVGAWVIASGETLEWIFSNLIESGAWQLIGYNTGAYDHTLHVRLYCGLPYAPATQSPPPLDLTGLTSYTPAAVGQLAAAEDLAGASP